MGKPVVPLDVHPILHPTGARTYVVVEPDSREAAVVDPVLDDLGEVLKALSAAKATVRWIVDTHWHADHLSGAVLLRERTGADVVMAASAGAAFVTRPVGEGDALPLGEQALRVRAAPGLAPEAIVLQGPGVLFTGDTLLVGTIGVRDAPGDDGAALYDTMQRLFEPLPDDTVVHPGHDDMGRWKTTIKAEKRGNRWLREKDRETFLARWASDPRPLAKTAKDLLAANREGPKAATADLAPVATVGQPAKGAGPVVAPQGMGGSQGGMAAARPPGVASESVASVFVVFGLACVVGCALGFLVHPLAHLVAGVAGAIAVGVGLASAARRPKRAAGGGLFYTGPQRRSPLR
ncbi:MAG: MBL fold metallo-hydrolase [Planctomycetes bacterium]|nr:MBL fold metallo-hydrolase [Planctomycetota bacterium]